MKCPCCGFPMSETHVCRATNYKTSPPLSETNPQYSAYLRQCDAGSYRKYMRKAEIDKTLHSLEGIMKGIAIDNSVNKLEVSELIEWFNCHSHMADTHPLSEIIPAVAAAIEDRHIDQDEAQDILWLCNQFKTENEYYNAVTSDLQRLQGILHGILADNILTKEELLGLRDWMNQNEHLACAYPYTEISSILCSVLADGIVSSEEALFLKAFFSDFINQNTSRHIDWEEINKAKKEMSLFGICASCPEILIPEQLFCFTGKSSKTSRAGFADVVTSLGGLFNNNVVESTSYLIIGNEGNPCWAFSCYGRKVEKAVTMRKTGHPILLIHENDFWDTVSDLR